MTQWQLLSERFAAMQQREKGLIFASVLLLTLWLGVIYLLEPMWQANTSLRQQTTQVQQQFVESSNLTQQLRQQLSVDQDAQIRSQLAELEQQQQQLTRQIQQNASHFIGAEQMISLLEKILQQSRGVQLNRLSSAPPEAVKLAGQAEDEPALLYQHKMTLVISGQYAQLSDTLKRLEQLPWLINWAGLTFKVTNYPQSEMQLELITVSEHEDIIRL